MDTEGGVLEPAACLAFQLADPFGGEPQLGTDVGEKVRLPVGEAVAEGHDAGFPGGE